MQKTGESGRSTLLRRLALLPSLVLPEGPFWTATLFQISLSRGEVSNSSSRGDSSQRPSGQGQEVGESECVTVSPQTDILNFFTPRVFCHRRTPEKLGDCTHTNAGSRGLPKINDRHGGRPFSDAEIKRISRAPHGARLLEAPAGESGPDHAPRTRR